MWYRSAILVASIGFGTGCGSDFRSPTDLASSVDAPAMYIHGERLSGGAGLAQLVGSLRAIVADPVKRGAFRGYLSHHAVTHAATAVDFLMKFEGLLGRFAGTSASLADRSTGAECDEESNSADRTQGGGGEPCPPFEIDGMSSANSCCASPPTSRNLSMGCTTVTLDDRTASYLSVSGEWTIRDGPGGAVIDTGEFSDWALYAQAVMDSENGGLTGSGVAVTIACDHDGWSYWGFQHDDDTSWTNQSGL